MTQPRDKPAVEHSADLQATSLEDKWQNKLYRARQLRKDGTQALFSRCQLLVSVYDDEQYHAECEANGVVVEDELDREVADFCESFLLVKAVYDANPDVEPWLRHGFLYLAHELASAQKRERQPGVSYKQMYQEAQREIERLRAEIATLHESLRILGGYAPRSEGARKTHPTPK